MSQILLIETSATLRHVMGRLLEQHGYHTDIHHSIIDGLEHLVHSGSQYDGIVLGWPDQTCTHTDELLTLLCEPPFDETPLVVLAHEADSTKLGWVSGRMQTAFLMWDTFEDTVRVLPQLWNKQFPEPCLDIETDMPIRVLLVDDSPTARVKFRKLLDSCGYVTDTATNASEALEKIKREKFDIAIIDYFMPDENGDSLCRKLRNNPHSTSIMLAVLTSTYLDKVIQSSLAAGAVECMFKNESDELFKARVASMSRTIRINKRIEHERTHLEGILSSVGDGVYGVNREGLITFINPATRQILGYKEDDALIGYHPDTLFHKHESVNTYASPIDTHYLEQAIKEGKELHGIESIFTRTDGTPIQVEMTIFPLHVSGIHEGAVVAFRDVSVRKLLEEELKWQANHDPLTKLLNRKFFEDTLEQEVQRQHRSNEQSALLYIDLDRFKYINDTIGHSAGDQLLIEVGHQFQTRLRKSDLLARLGGDEFGILLRNVNTQEIFQVADIFRTTLAGYDFVRDGRSYKVHASIGIAMIDKHSLSHGEVLANADIACHIAKGKGRNSTHLYSTEQDNKMAMDLELGWSARLHNALEKNNFVLYYQSIIPLAELDLTELPSDESLCEFLARKSKTNCRTYEVLLRMHNSRGEPISPNAFLPTAERFNMMRDIDSWVIKAAIKKMAELGPENAHINFTINLSGQSLDPDLLVPIFKDAVNQYQIDPKRFLFEITETCAINDTAAARGVIEQLGSLGVRFALDDFGSGYCSFSHLKRLPVDYIKIDGIFVKDILTDPMDSAIVRSITNIAHSLGKQTVAEFVESAEVIQLLKECGVDHIQGYYVDKPSPLMLGEITKITNQESSLG